MPGLSQSEAIAVRHDLRAFGEDAPRSWADSSHADQLCARCRLIDWDPTRTYLSIADERSFYPKIPLYERQPKLQQIREAAHLGCHLCTLILTSLLTMRYRTSIGVDPKPEGLKEIGDNTSIQINVEAMARTPPVWLTVGIQNHGILEGWLDISTPIVTSMSNIVGAVNSTSPACAVAKYWLEDCQQHHQQCRANDPKLPRRILDVSRTNVFLVEDVKFAAYTALSYKIGGTTLFTTTAATLKDRKAGFLIEQLPKTVRDAIWWTRTLGLSYIWIDSLCILQDSLTDWEVELSTMADIYHNATVVIAAGASENASQGCLPVQSKLAKIPCQPAPGVAILPDFERDRWIHFKGALDTRAWTFQEVQLATRVLRVGGEELSWQCRKCKRRENMPMEEHDHNVQAYGFALGSRALDARNIMKQDMFRTWYVLARDFNSRDISFTADRLPAFSGMAKLFQDELQATYVCGIWKEDIHRGLLWRSTHMGFFTTYRAPSWSWVAVEGNQLAWAWELLRATGDEWLFEIHEVRVFVPGQNPFGRVTGGRLVLSGFVAPLPSYLCRDTSDTGLFEWKWPLLMLDIDCVPAPGSLLLRLHQMFCLVLEPTGKEVYRRIGSLVMPSQFYRQQRMVVELLDSYLWTRRLLFVI